MKTSELKRINEAPNAGTRMIYTRKEVLFGEYDSKDRCLDEIAEHDILELHMFDDEKEYRALSSESVRSESGVLEHVADFKDDDSIYKETCFLENGEKIIVLNHIAYDESNGMASVDDYRMKRG